jgi:hypothetical protein
MVKWGPVEDVQYDEEGRVLGWKQTAIGSNERGGSTLFYETELGRKERMDRWIKRYKGELDYWRQDKKEKQ